MRIVAAAGAAAVFAAGVALAAAPPPLPLLRPPGMASPADFAARCVRCGRCLEACPYQAIHAAPLNAGRAASTPFVNARAQACRLCRDFPCAAVCPTGALAVPEERADAAMGTAVVNEETCLSFQGMRCEVCYRACPLIDEAIRIDYRPREGDAIHAVFAPQVNAEVCPGCGLCEQRCPVGDPAPAIVVVPTGADEAAYLALRNDAV
ncbi:MAG: 4Fe-4S dicluster domain-containing protein [Adlercreutzia mucosicola]|nr:4Fe-4S dicluster domain-containing protein [Adlercreutzia mucosicola]